MRIDRDTLRLAMKVHRELSDAIAPATPGTIEASQLSRNWVLQVIGGTGGIALVLLVILTAWPQLGAWLAFGTDSADPTLKRVLGAILGATLFALWSARTYIRDGTFKKQYYQYYLHRFVLGIFTGFLIGELASTNVQLREVAEGYGVLAIAIVGGFAAEAVIQILQRIADILVAAIRGNEWEQARTQAETETRRRLGEAAAQVQDALAETDDAAREEALRDAVSRMRQR
ncbi:hypothetical protein [Maricaulis parjimensis]|uniref:hypothetical protein n=1 Tax=Maricaulis parjimensis TaxID=144023 RepID=UPI00193AA653|nr:hypothetical protein [Maricaulis parjimensis]